MYILQHVKTRHNLLIMVLQEWELIANGCTNFDEIINLVGEHQNLDSS